MIDHVGIFPAAVVVAITIFLLKEGIEACRRWRTNKRKMHAICRLIAKECERCFWVVRWILSSAPQVESACGEGATITIELTQTDAKRLVIDWNHPGSSSSPIGRAPTSTIERYLFEVAALDRRMFALMEDALSAAAELNHVTDGLIEHVTGEQRFLDSWSWYAVREAEAARPLIDALYRHCMGSALETARLR